MEGSDKIERYLPFGEESETLGSPPSPLSTFTPSFPNLSFKLSNSAVSLLISPHTIDEILCVCVSSGKTW
jgi:hypothetical protein